MRITRSHGGEPKRRRLLAPCDPGRDRKPPTTSSRRGWGDQGSWEGGKDRGSWGITREKKIYELETTGIMGLGTE